MTIQGVDEEAGLRRHANQEWESSEMRQMGYSREDFERAADIVARSMEEHAKLVVGVGFNDAIKIGESGEILGRAVTGTTSGTMPHAIERRAKFDEAIGGNIIYGTLTLNPSTYGNTTLILDKSPLKDATATPGDSIDQIVGDWRLDKGTPQEIRDAFTRYATPGANAHKMLAYSLLNVTRYRHGIDEVLSTGKVNDNFLRHLTDQEKGIPYVEIQMLAPQGKGIGKEHVRGILARSLYPGRMFESEAPRWRKLKATFPDIPIKQSEYGLYDMMNFDDLVDLPGG